MVDIGEIVQITTDELKHIFDKSNPGKYKSVKNFDNYIKRYTYSFYHVLEYDDVINKYKLRCCYREIDMCHHQILIILPIDTMVIRTSIGIAELLSGISMYFNQSEYKEILQFNLYDTTLRHKVLSPHIIVSGLPLHSLTLEVDNDNKTETVSLSDIIR